MHHSQAGHQSLNSLDVVDMETDLLLETIKLLVHLDLQVMSSRLYLGLELVELLLLIREECPPLVICILLPELLDPHGLLDL